MNETDINKAIQEYYVDQPIQDRRIKIFTGAGGMELVQIAFEESVGLYRIYLGKQIPRILRRLNFKIFKSAHYGKYYKLLDRNNGKMVLHTGRRES